VFERLAQFAEGAMENDANGDLWCTVYSCHAAVWGVLKKSQVHYLPLSATKPSEGLR